MGDRRHDQHYDVGALHRFADLRVGVAEWYEAVVDPPDLNAALSPDGFKAVWIADVKANMEAAKRKIRGCGEAAVPGPEHRDGLNRGHFKKSLVKTRPVSTGAVMISISIRDFCIASHFSFVE